LTAVVYLDNVSPAGDNKFYADLRHSVSTGARVAVHAPETRPFMKRGIVVSPGVETTVEVIELRRVRLPQPWGLCVDEQNLKPPRGYSHDSVRYTIESCSEICIQEKVDTLDLKK